MNQGIMKVLLLGESECGSSYLRRQLERRGCHCSFARSAEESIAIFGEHSFQLILSTSPVHQEHALLAELGDSNCAAFCSCPVEDGCWWVPVVHHGRRCLGAPALRPSEFIGALDEMFREVQLEDARGRESRRRFSHDDSRTFEIAP